MRERLPLFPLGMVLFPGVVLPLNIFEPRYRALIEDLLARSQPDRQFGVIAIREGFEVGADGVRALHEIGCAAVLQSCQEQPDGRFEIVTMGLRRFRLERLHAGTEQTPYFTGEVEWLPDEIGDQDVGQVLAASVTAAYADYLGALAEAHGSAVNAPDPPPDPLSLSHFIGATTLLDLRERQALLAEPDGCRRLRAELSVLRRESVLLRTLRAAPTSDYVKQSASPN